MEWLYGDKLESVELIKEFEEQINYKFSKDFKNFILENNGACPFPNTFDGKVSKENVFDHLMSFNKDDKGNIWNANFKSDYKSDKYIIFGICSFGDFLCFDRKTNNVIYLEHETMKTEEIASTFTKFINSLYDFDDPNIQKKVI